MTPLCVPPRALCFHQYLKVLMIEMNPSLSKAIDFEGKLGCDSEYNSTLEIVLILCLFRTAVKKT